jgi:glycosyltransferase involved in cell wall biosynthesis
MKVLQLGPYPPPHGGVQTNLVAIHEYLRRRGIACAVINLTRFRKPGADEVYYPASALQLIRLLLRLRFDVLHLHIGGDLTPRLLALGLVCSLKPGSKSVLTFHSGGYPSSPQGRTARPGTLRGFVFRRFDFLIGVNAEIVELFHRFGVPPERTRLVGPHAFAAGSAGAVDARPQALQALFAAHSPLLLTVGLLEPEYDLPLQIEVLGLVREKYPQAGLAIIGAGSLEADLTARIAAKPYAEHILLCGDVPHAGTLRAIEECSVFLRTTLYDGDSISVREALHVGAVVIASQNGMRPPGVRLIPPANLEALREAILEALAAPPTRKPPAPADETNLQAVLDIYETCGASCK